MKNIQIEDKWDVVILPRRTYFDLGLRKIILYKDLLYMFVRKEIAVQYKQTILGPLWFIVQPILTTIMFAFVFGNIAKISTDGLPQPLFYMSGIIIWGFFADCFNKTSDTFTQNAGIFGKVYFPRLIIPLSIVFSNLIKLLIQFILFIILFIYFNITQDIKVNINIYVILLPLLILIMGSLGLGGGLILSSLTTRYKDLKFLIQFGIQLLMYVTPIIYPLSSIDTDKQLILLLNPISAVVEAFRFIITGVGYLNILWIIYSLIVSISLLMIGILIFNKTEETFMDVV